MTSCVTMEQDIYKEPYYPVEVISLDENLLTPDYLDLCFDNSNSTTLGISALYGKKSELSHLAIATDSLVLLIRLVTNRSLTHKPHERRVLEDKVLCNPDFEKLAFDAERLATALFLDCGYCINNLVDIQSLLPMKPNRGSTAALQVSLGGQHRLNMKGVMCAFRQSHKEESLRNRALVLRAWSSYVVATLPQVAVVLHAARTIDTQSISSLELAVLAKSVRDYDRLVALKPTRVKNDIASDVNLRKGNLQLNLSRFKTRMRTSDSQVIEVKINNGGKTSKVFGRVTEVKGKSAQVSLKSGVAQGGRISVSTLGKDDPTNSEMERTDVVLTCLQKANSLFTESFTTWIFLGRRFPTSPSTTRPSICFPGTRQLNDSQTLAVKRILSNASSDRVCLVQGPPGTGKTTVIAASVHSFLANPNSGLGSAMWLMAQSNVAVKNIAEKLAETGFFDFKLLVSLDFHFDWHEHLYHRIEANVIRSDNFSTLGRRLGGCKIILCTLAMLCHPNLGTSGVLQLAPIHTVILDEASQIEVGDYLPLLSKFGRQLRKLVFIGDDKQLAPFGQDDIGNLRSVFELDHLQTNVVFLDTQYRMPTPLGDFLSQHVYNDQLLSVHAIPARKSCRFVDIHHGRERKLGNSWVNTEEVQAVIHIARKYAAAGKSYRIITPYDAQRGTIERSLKEASIPWEDKCFNVDSFQGNEADHIILSVVRSDKVGFLRNLRRSNVMLSRCKRSMMICTNRHFLEGIASETLLGKLADEWTTAGQEWLNWRDILASRF